MPEKQATWYRSMRWYYIVAVFGAYLYAPEVRRVFDWRSGFSAISIISILPLLLLVPAAYLAPKLLRSAGRDLAICVWLWIGAFAYGYAIAIASNNLIAGSYTLALFMLPPAFGIFLAAMGWPASLLYDRIANLLLTLAVPAAVYGIFQFIAPPPWDVAWILSANIDSIGQPHAFAFRPFGTLNAPGPFADCLAMVLILNFPKLDFRSRLRLFQFAVITAALVLTLVRSAWIAAVIGIVAYVLLSPGRGRNITILIGVALAIGLFAANVGTLLGSTGAADTLSTRFSSFSNFAADESFQVRVTYFGARLSEAIAEPLGQGLGLLGTAAKLGTSGATLDFDNGYIARLTELGYFGTTLYLATIGSALFFAVRQWRRARSAKHIDAIRVTSAVIALQVALIFLDTSSDHHNALNGVFFWISVAIAAGAPALAQVVVRAEPRRRAA